MCIRDRYISVRSQADIEESDRQMEIAHLAADPEGELLELTQIYIDRGLTPELATQVAAAFTERNALEAHLRDELGHMRQTQPSRCRQLWPRRSPSLSAQQFHCLAH